MLRIITAATALTVLVACDSEGIDRATTSDQLSNEMSSSVTESSEGTGADTTTAGNSGNDTTGGLNNNDGSNDNSTTTGEQTSTGGNDPDGGSSTSDGGQTSTQTNDVDGGSSTSDGGQTNTQNENQNGGIVSDDGGTEVTSEPAVNNNSDAGSFSTDIGSGNVVRSSSVASNSAETMCTTFSNRDDYSNIYFGDFILHNNAWRAFRAAEGFEWEQCIFTNTDGSVGWNYKWGPGRTGINGNPNASGDFYVRSYPELIYGVKDEFRVSADQSVTGLPVKISEMPTFQIDYAYSSEQFGESRPVQASNNPRFPNDSDLNPSSISGERNVAVESFFYEPDAAGNCTAGIVSRDGDSTHTYEVMVWLDAGAERLPAGPDDFVANLTIRGAAYKVYTKDSDSRYIAFVAQNPQTTGTIYMNDFIDWARDNAHVVTDRFGAKSNSDQIQDDWCMANILVGTEIFWGAGNMNITQWDITQIR